MAKTSEKQDVAGIVLSGTAAVPLAWRTDADGGETMAVAVVLDATPDGSTLKELRANAETVLAEIGGCHPYTAKSIAGKLRRRRPAFAASASPTCIVVAHPDTAGGHDSGTVVAGEVGEAHDAA